MVSKWQGLMELGLALPPEPVCFHGIRLPNTRCSDVSGEEIVF